MEFFCRDIVFASVAWQDLNQFGEEVERGWIAYRRRAIPLVWKLIDKGSVTDTASQIELLEHLVPLIPKRE